MCERGMNAVPTALSYILLIVTIPGYPNYSPTESAVEGSWDKPERRHMHFPSSSKKVKLYKTAART